MYQKRPRRATKSGPDYVTLARELREVGAEVFFPERQLSKRERQGVVNLYLASGEVTEEDLIAIYPYIKRSFMAQVFAEHEAAGVVLWRKIVQNERHHGTLVAVAKAEGARLDEEVRSALEKIDDIFIKRLLARDEKGERVDELFRDVAKKDPYSGIKLLEEVGSEGRRDISPKGMADILKHQDEKLRRKGLFMAKDIARNKNKRKERKR